MVRDRRLEGGSTVWLGPPHEGRADPECVLVLKHSEVKTPVDHLGFQCVCQSDVDAVIAREGDAGILVGRPRDAGGSIDCYVLDREPGGHLLEFTLGQPILGLGTQIQGSAASA